MGRGLGLEARLGNSNWLARVEYLHYDFGDSGSLSTFTPAGAVVLASTSSSSRMTTDLVRAGLSYKLDWPGMAGGGPTAAIAVKAPVAAVWSWSGFYVGAHAGYGWGHDPSAASVPFAEVNETDLILPVMMNGPNSHGYVGGFQAGANWQSGRILGGLEIDLSTTGIKGSTSASGFDVFGSPVAGSRTEKFDLLGSARARLGYLVSPDLWLYGTGGLAWTRFEQTVMDHNLNGTIIATAPSWRFGWVAGAGGELRLWNSNWLARLEYLHYDFGNSGSIFQGFNSTQFGLETDTLVTSRHLTADVVRAGLDYKFN
jgi:outer membrane immunogenic protein